MKNLSTTASRIPQRACYVDRVEYDERDKRDMENNSIYQKDGVAAVNGTKCVIATHRDNNFGHEKH